jgi:hypothetical protein
VGINLSNPEQVSYQYKLDGYEEEWSDVSQVPYAYYGALSDGNTLSCSGLAMAAETVPKTPLTLDISVKIPIWKAWWFIVSRWSWRY